MNDRGKHSCLSPIRRKQPWKCSQDLSGPSFDVHHPPICATYEFSAQFYHKFSQSCWQFDHNMCNAAQFTNPPYHPLQPRYALEMVPQSCFIAFLLPCPGSRRERNASSESMCVFGWPIPRRGELLVLTPSLECLFPRMPLVLYSFNLMPINSVLKSEQIQPSFAYQGIKANVCK